MKKVAVILAGCGVFDGSEINEVVLTLLQLEKNQAQYQCFAPNIKQHHTINHITGEEMPESRNVLVEAARIVRGEIAALDQLNVTEFDALIVPGGFGAAKNLSDFAFKGAQMTVHEQVLTACKNFAEAKKPAGYMCIAPALLPFIYTQPTLTIGTDKDTAAVLTELGARHQSCAVDDVIIDTQHKLVSTPAYMLARDLVAAERGIAKLVQNVLALS